MSAPDNNGSDDAGTSPRVKGKVSAPEGRVSPLAVSLGSGVAGTFAPGRG